MLDNCYFSVNYLGTIHYLNPPLATNVVAKGGIMIYIARLMSIHFHIL